MSKKCPSECLISYSASKTRWRQSKSPDFEWRLNISHQTLLRFQRTQLRGEGGVGLMGRKGRRTVEVGNGIITRIWQYGSWQPCQSFLYLVCKLRCLLGIQRHSVQQATTMAITRTKAMTRTATNVSNIKKIGRAHV